MGSIVGVFNTAHTPFCYRYPHLWNGRRGRRVIREDVPLDDEATNKEKFDRIQVGFSTLRQKLADLSPDAVVVIGDDQGECFDLTNFPSFAVYVGEEFEGPLAVRDSEETPPDPEHKNWGRRRGHPQLATSILTGLMHRGFDPAFCMDLPKPDKGLGHAILRPAESIIDADTPIVPVLLNCYFAPQVSGQRAFQLGTAIRESVEASPDDYRVAVVGSGGLWHSQGYGPAYLDEDYDLGVLEYVKSGDARGMAEFFDSYVQPIESPRARVTGMPPASGPQGGTRETCNWIAATAAGGGARSEVVDYIPVYASPIGVSFSYSI